MDFFEAVSSRHSYRGSYTDAQVKEEDLIKILDAGIRAPSGCNAQTTGFILVTNRELREKVADILPYAAVKTAPALVAVVTEKVVFGFGLDFELEDYAASVTSILLAATALGYASLWLDGTTRLEGRDAALAKLLGVPENKSLRCILPIGVPGAKKEQAARKPFNERVDWRR